MAKPLYWIVWVNGSPRNFTQRSAARLYAAAQKALGHQIIIKAVGFDA